MPTAAAALWQTIIKTALLSVTFATHLLTLRSVVSQLLLSLLALLPHSQRVFRAAWLFNLSIID